jgi:ABC-type Fe2+-enterobactin transport system substrate-binding protein
LSRIPIKNISEGEQLPFVNKADIILNKKIELNQLQQQFTQLLEAKFPTLNINNKLQSWASLKSNEFFKELEKQKIKLTLSQQQEWLQYFEEQKLKANDVQQVIKQTDKEIDAMVYALYGLNEEEIGLVEGRNG